MTGTKQAKGVSISVGYDERITELERRVSILEHKIMYPASYNTTASMLVLSWFITHDKLYLAEFYEYATTLYNQGSVRNAIHHLYKKDILIHVRKGVYELNQHYDSGRTKSI